MKLFFSTFLIGLITLMTSCSQKLIDVQGHRGCRGYYPENTIESFIYALSLGVNTLELDAIISKDSMVVVSHEAFFNSEITTLPDGSFLNKDNERNHNIYRMNYVEVKKYDVGLKYYSRFPNQKKIACYKPTLAEMIDKCESYIKEKNLKPVKYNIEYKVDSKVPDEFCPDYPTFAKLVLDVIKLKGIEKRTNIQSFDHELLNECYKINPDIKKAILVGDREPVAAHLAKLIFKPQIYSPYFELVTNETIEECHEKNMKVIPWTINQENDIKKILELNIDGIITDYPKLVIDIIKENKAPKNK